MRPKIESGSALSMLPPRKSAGGSRFAKFTTRTRGKRVNLVTLHTAGGQTADRWKFAIARPANDAAGCGSLHVTGGARIIGARKRRCRHTTGGSQSLWKPRVALDPEGRVFCAPTHARSFKHRSRNCLADPHRSPLFLIKTGTNFLKGSIQTPGKDELRQEYLFAQGLSMDQPRQQSSRADILTFPHMTRKDEQLLQTVLNNMSQGVLMFDSETR